MNCRFGMPIWGRFLPLGVKVGRHRPFLAGEARGTWYSRLNSSNNDDRLGFNLRMALPKYCTGPPSLHTIRTAQDIESS